MLLALVYMYTHLRTPSVYSGVRVRVPICARKFVRRWVARAYVGCVCTVRLLDMPEDPFKQLLPMRMFRNSLAVCRLEGYTISRGKCF